MFFLDDESQQNNFNYGFVIISNSSTTVFNAYYNKINFGIFEQTYLQLPINVFVLLVCEFSLKSLSHSNLHNGLCFILFQSFFFYYFIIN